MQRRILATLAGLMLLAAASHAPAAAASRALLIGIDDYTDDRLDLPSAGAQDVAAMTEVATSRFGVAPDGIKTLLDQQATRRAILEAIDSWLVQGTVAGDTALLYFAGHGYFSLDENGDETDGLDEAIVPADAEVSGIHVLRLITDDELTTAIGKLEGRKVTAILDTGHSGRVTRDKLKTRAIAIESKGAVLARTPDLEQLTRSILIEPAVKKQKAEAAKGETLIEKAPKNADLSVWSAVSPSQTALVDVASGHGVFTKLYVEGAAGAADRNGNGIVSNAELLAYVTEGSAAFCDATAKACEMGLTPTLEPDAALAGAPKAAPAEAGGDDSGTTLTADAVTDLLATGNRAGVGLEQLPASPINAGTRNVRYRLTSPTDGRLLLLDLSDDGTLTQLFPNQFTQKRDGAASGTVKAGVPVTIPDDYYGISFDATTPGSGTIVAIVVPPATKIGGGVATRQIAVIPKDEAKAVLLEAAQAASKQENAASELNTEASRSSVVTLRYEILP
ncbi:MAG: caspase family protein [Hyphomicrobiaceae bacterium]